MKLSILFLIIVSLLQTTILPINLSLILILIFALSKTQPANYYLALFAGILLGVLGNTNLGFYPLLFLITVQLASLLKHLPSSNNLLLVPISVVLLVLLVAAESWLLGTPMDVNQYLVDIVIFLLALLVWRLINRRLNTESDYRLRVH